ncbi:MAG: SDR family oxidoreductase [Cyclobacteriaceae bacterium]|nr:SDR family oxidoreductase [Cyclobacteriaceae bacterium]
MSSSRTNTDFNNQVAVITGGSSGLGLAISKALLDCGAYVAILDLQICSELENHPHVLFQSIDITQEEKLREIINVVWRKFERIDILINSAGITGITNLKSHETSSENIRKVFDVNFMGCYLASKHVLPFMLKNNYGRILHIASIAGKEGNAGMLAYSSSKAAVIGMTKVQGKEYAETGVTINALAPAVVQTHMVDMMPPEQVRYMTDKIPMKRCGTLEEIANLALYIVSSKNSFTTGFTFDLSGGRATY